MFALVPCFLIGVIGAGLGADPSEHLSSAALPTAVIDGLATALPLLAVCIATAVGMAHGLARLQSRTPVPAAVTAACLFVLTVPSTTPLVPAGLSMAFGWAIGREVFGGAERSFVHPAVLAHVFLALSWPGALDGVPLGATGAASVFACVLGALWVLGTGRVSWRVAASVPVGAAMAFAALAPSTTGETSGRSFFEHFLVGNLSLGALFLAGQPMSSPQTTSAQWFHGALVGALVILLRLTGSDAPGGTMSAILLGSVFAPLADEVVRYGQRRSNG